MSRFSANLSDGRRSTKGVWQQYVDVRGYVVVLPRRVSGVLKGIRKGVIVARQNYCDWDGGIID